MKFSIRDLFLVTTIVALALGFAGTSMLAFSLQKTLDRMRFERDSLANELESNGYRVLPDKYGLDVKTPQGVYIRRTFDTQAPPRPMPDSSLPTANPPSPDPPKGKGVGLR